MSAAQLGTRAHRGALAAALLAVLALVLSGCGFTGLYSASLPGGANLGSHPFTMTAYFADVLDLVPQSAVKVNDVAVGKVSKIALADCKTSSGHTAWCAKVTMNVNDSVKLPANARAEIMQTSLLGEKYVSLEQPTGAASTARLGNNSTIAYDDTTSAPEVEQVLGALSLLLNEGGLTQIRVIAHELNNALGTPQRRSAARDLITQLNTFTGTLDKQKAKITSALDSLNRLSSSLNKQKSVITDSLDTFPQALSILRQNTPDIVHLLVSLDRLGSVATRVINETQTPLVSSLKKLEPVLSQLIVTGGALPKSLRILLSFPFPLGNTLQFVKGDYANLALSIKLNLFDQLCGLSGSLGLSGLGCNTQQPGLPTTTSARRSLGTSGTAAGSLPTLIGAGR